jgi:hypothetical protein
MVKEDPPKVPWRVERVLADGSVTMVFSPPGEGKSLVAASFAAAAAGGESIAGLNTRKGRIVYIDAENGAWEIHRRVKALGLPAEGVAVYETGDAFDLRKDGEEVGRILKAERSCGPRPRARSVALLDLAGLRTFDGAHVEMASTVPLVVFVTGSSTISAMRSRSSRTMRLRTPLS